jgi:hypothetical protein
MSYMTFRTPNWRSYSAAHQHSAVRTIKAVILDDSRPKAVLIQTATRERGCRSGASCTSPTKVCSTSRTGSANRSAWTDTGDSMTTAFTHRRPSQRVPLFSGADARAAAPIPRGQPVSLTSGAPLQAASEGRRVLFARRLLARGPPSPALRSSRLRSLFLPKIARLTCVNRVRPVDDRGMSIGVACGAMAERPEGRAWLRRLFPLFYEGEPMSFIARKPLRPDDRLSRGQSALVITGLSALSWCLLIWLVISILKETLG